MLPICILAIRDDDDRAYMTRLFVKYQRLMYRTIYDILGDKWATEDVLQTTLLRLIDHLDTLRRLEPEGLAGYIAAACRHTAYNAVRDSDRHPWLPLDGGPEVPDERQEVEDRVLRRLELDALAQVWPRLDENTRWLLEARYILDYSDGELARELEKNLETGEQSILFLNRRGSSRELLCPQCGYVPQCPRCSVYLTYHSANGRMMCHYCGYSEKSSEACPECGGAMKHIGVGTQRAEEELHALFPEAEILRMDADTVSQGHEKILRDFQVRRVPILLGTQMVAKGLDFANVTLVGVLAADMSLYVDHYRASERTFSLLTQVVGRAGRGDKPGRAVIQTYTPQNDVILAAADQDYDRFYDGEIRLRQLRRDPPFADQFFITVTGPEEGPVRRAAAGLRDGLRSAAGQEPYRGMALDILGPAPAPVVKVNNRYRYRVTVIGRNDKTLRGLLSAFMKEFSRRPEHKALHIYTDCNLMD